MAGNFLYCSLVISQNNKSEIRYYVLTPDTYWIRVSILTAACFRVPRGVVMLDHITQRKYSTIHVVKTLYFCRSITALFIIFIAPLPHFLAKLLVRCRTILHKKPHQTLVPAPDPCRSSLGGARATSLAPRDAKRSLRSLGGAPQKRLAALA